MHTKRETIVMKKLRCEKTADHFATALIHAMGSDKDEDHQRPYMDRIYEKFPKEAADSILRLARTAAAANEEVLGEIQSGFDW
jgi:hypothetical protein